MVQVIIVPSVWMYSLVHELQAIATGLRGLHVETGAKGDQGCITI